MSTIPAAAVAQLRVALHSELGNVAQELDEIVVTSGRARDDWSPPVARFDRTRSLLDELGWNERNPERDIDIDLDRHRQVIVEGLREALESERYLMSERASTPHGNAARPGHGGPQSKRSWTTPAWSAPDAAPSYRTGDRGQAQAQPDLWSALSRLRPARVRRARQRSRRMDASQGADRAGEHPRGRATRHLAP